MKKNVNQFMDIQRIDASKISLSNRKSKFVEIYLQQTDSEVENQSGRCLDCGNPYCQWKCPVHNYIPNWLSLAEQGRIVEAAELSHQTNSFPEICGRVCPQERLCEGSCTLDDGFGAVSIGNVERYITDKAFSMGWKPNGTVALESSKHIAVIGAGPAGLACADFLNREGFQVTVFDRQSAIGGLMTFGIPAFKLEKNIIQRRFKLFQERGINFNLNVEIGKDIEFNKIVNDYDAVFLAAGVYQSVKDNSVPIATPGVLDALDFLTEINSKVIDNVDLDIDNYIKGKSVLVLGGGDTTMDCIRTSIRLGAENVTGVYRRGIADMPGSKREYINAGEEGSNFIFNAKPVGLLCDGNKINGVRFIKTVIEGNANNKRATFREIPDSEFDIAADIVITAFGFKAEALEWINEQKIMRDEHGRVKVKNNSTQTQHEKVFSGGDLVRGASLVVYAIADGRQAALEIKKFLQT